MNEFEALRAIPQRYSRALDSRDMDALADLFDPTGTVEGMRGTTPVPEYLEMMRASSGAYARKMHFLGDPLIDYVDGTDIAHLDTYGIIQAFDRVEGGGTVPGAVEGSGDFMLGARYLDEVVRTGGVWRIFHRKIEVLFHRELK